jgi:hypothetical protein
MSRVLSSFPVYRQWPPGYRTAPDNGDVDEPPLVGLSEVCDWYAAPDSQRQLVPGPTAVVPSRPENADESVLQDGPTALSNNGRLVKLYVKAHWRHGAAR